jgi:CheY-like chemotaxis protein
LDPGTANVGADVVSDARLHATATQIRREAGGDVVDMISERTGTITCERAVVRARGAVSSGRTTVVIADDHAGFRCALESLIRSAGDLELIGSACDGAEAVRLTTQLMPHVVVMDLTMPGMNGVEATRAIRRHHPDSAVVALSGSHELTRDVIEAGAACSVLKDVDPMRLLEVIRAAARQQRRGSG